MKTNQELYDEIENELMQKGLIRNKNKPIPKKPRNCQWCGGDSKKPPVAYCTFYNYEGWYCFGCVWLAGQADDAMNKDLT